MGKVRENLDGGLVDGADPAQLRPGQLSYIQNVTYKPAGPSLQRATGRAVFGQVTGLGGGATHVAADVNGLRDADFDWGAGHYLIAQVSGATAAYATASVTAAEPVTWGVLSTAMTAGASLEIVQHNNRFFLLNGATAAENELGSNGVFYLSATAANTPPQVRQHGMLPVNATPEVTTAASAFSITDVGASGYYEYWTTEVAKIQQDGVEIELESTFGATVTGTAAGSKVATVFVSDVTTVAPVITMPTVRNAITTHWRVYRSPKKQFSNDNEFPAGFSIGTFSISGVSAGQITDTLASASGSFAFPASANLTANNEVYANFTSASAATAAGGDYASATGSLPPGWHGAGTQKQAYYAYPFGGFKGFVQGITVEMKCYATGAPFYGVPVTVELMKRGNGGKPAGGPYAVKSVNVTATSPGQVVTLGGATDTWLPPNVPGFVDSDFDATFQTVVSVPYGHFALDYIKVKPNYGLGARQDSIIPFPTVVYTFGDISAQVGKNGTPPSSDTGDIYEDCLVLNDKSNPSLIRYSFPGLPESFPATYFLDFETRNNDIVRWIKVVNNRLLVALDNSVWRVNYLPSERDASFDRGKATEPLTQTYGGVNPMCVCTFSMNNATQYLAWVSQKGIHVTDGYTFDTMTDILNWRNILSTISTSVPISLVNDPENKLLKFLYRNDGLTPEVEKELQLSYAESHIENSNLKVCGQVNMRNYHTASTSAAHPKSMWAVPRANGDTSVYIGYGSATAASGGCVMRETGANIPALDPTMGYKSRRMFLGGEGKEVEVHTVYGYLGSYTTAVGSALGVDMTLLNCKTNDDGGERTVASGTIGFNGRKLGKWQNRAMTEGLVLSVAVTGNPQRAVSFDYLLIEGEGFGEEDSGL